MPFLVDDDRENEYDGSPDSVHAYLPKLAHEQFDEGRQHVLVRVTGLAVQGIVEEARKQGDPKRAFSLAREAMQVVYELDFMLHPREKSAENRTWMWWHIRGGGIVPAGKENKCSIAKNEFERAAGHYVARRWMQNDYIDWCIVDALVRYEWAAYYHSITDRTPALLLGEADFKWVVRTFYAIFYSVCFGLSLWGVQNLYAVQSPWATPAAWLFALVSTWEVITIIRGGRRRRRARAKDTELQTRLLMAMHDTYDSLDGTALSPTRVRDAMQSAKDKGVVYSQVVWPIIDAAVARDPHVWKVSPPDEVF